MKMKGILAVAALASLASAAVAQDYVTFTEVLDADTATGGAVYSSDYNAAEDLFVTSVTGVTLKLISGSTGADTGNTMDVTTPAPAGLGFFTVTCAADGRVFGFENNATTLWLYDNTSDTTPTAAATAVPFSRTGHVSGAGTNTVVVLTGSADNGPMHIYTTTDGTTYTLANSPVVQAKSGIAVDDAVTKVWAVGDVATNNLQKFTGSIAGAWTEDTVTWPATTVGDGSGSMAYDNVNDVLFVLPTGTGAARGHIYALDPDNAAVLTSDPVGFTVANEGRAEVTALPSTTTGYNGAHVTSTTGSGTVWMTGRSATANNGYYLKYTYTVGTPSNVTDWSAHSF